MSKYTTEVRYICEVNADLDESAGYDDVDTIIASARTKIFDFSYPIFDNSYKSVLETKILKHYYTREIGAETVGLWKLWLSARMNEIMPYYNKLYESELIKFDPMLDYDITKEGNKEGIGETVNSGSDRVVNQASGSDTVVNQASGNDTIVNQASGNDKTVNQLSGSDEVVGESGGNTNRETEYDGTDTINTADAQKLNRWDMYSDTPQGDIIAMDNDQYRYLTNARHITEDGTGSTKTETKNYGQVVDETATYVDESTSTTNYGKKEEETTTHGKRIQETTTHGKKTDETITHGKKTDETITHGKKIDASSTEEYLEHIYGKISGVSYSKLLEEYRDTLLNIDMLIIRDLADLFFNLW